MTAIWFVAAADGTFAWPYAFQPQQLTSPSTDSEQVKSSPAETAACGDVTGTSDWL